MLQESDPHGRLKRGTPQRASCRILQECPTVTELFQMNALMCFAQPHPHKCVCVRVSATNLAKETVSQSCLAKVLQQCFLLDTVKAMSKNNISHLKTPNHIQLCLYVYINIINVITIHVYKIRYPPRSSSVALFFWETRLLTSC